MVANPLVSVIVPAYNHERYVQETIRSIIDQNYKNIELIIIDDGSSDSTFEKIQAMESECRKRFVRFIYQKQKNQGTGPTQNRLISLAKGKYIYPIASDDLSKSTAIKKEVDFLEKNPDYVLCVGDNEIIDANGNNISWNKRRRAVPLSKGFQKFSSYLQFKGEIPVFNSKEFGSYATLARKNYIVNGYLIRKDVFEKIGEYSPKAPLEDWYLMLQLSKFGKFKFIDEVLFSYRWHRHNTTKKRKRMNVFQRKTILYEEELLKKKYPELLPAFYAGTQKRECLFRIPSILELYKEKNLYYKRIKLVLLKIPMLIYQKRLKKEK